MPIPKVAYYKFLPKWDMAFGTQVNLDDVEVRVQAIGASTQSRIGASAALIVCVIAVLLLIVAVVGLFLSNGLVKPVLMIKKKPG